MNEKVLAAFPQFRKSLLNHQKLVDIILREQGDDGICLISQQEMARQLGRSVNWVSAAIKRLNTVGVCVEKLGPQQYRVAYSDISSRGVFGRLSELLAAYLENPRILEADNQELAEAYDMPITAIYMFAAYVSAQ